jgi:WW domain-binding protein 4
MSEFWVSKKKYFCKYCEIYIADDAPSRRQHETGMRHIGNRDRFIRGLYKEGEKRKKDLEDEKREMERVDKARLLNFIALRFIF